MPGTVHSTQYADPVDTERYGEYRVHRAAGDERPLYRFTDRVSAVADARFRAEPGRYHLYAGWFCPWSQRSTIEIALNGLQDVVSVSYVDDARDGRGRAFREKHGPDPVNGFALLREAYEVSEPGFDGHISVPTLWDRAQGRIVSDDYAKLDVDLATEFALLAQRRYLLGERLTHADVRLWVSLVRYDPAVIGAAAPALREYPQLWSYARDLYDVPAFAATTDFATFTAPGTTLPDWRAPHGRDALTSAQ